MLPEHVIFVSKMLLTRKSITNRPCRVPYTIFPMSVYYKQKQYLVMTYRNRAHILCTCYMYYTRTHRHDDFPPK